MLAACKLSKQVGAKAILGNTVSGYTGFKLSSHRPHAKIYIFTPNRNLINKLSLLWGVEGFYYADDVSTDKTFEDHERILVENGHIDKGDVIISTASMPIHERGRTNTLKLNIVK